MNKEQLNKSEDWKEGYIDGYLEAAEKYRCLNEVKRLLENIGFDIKRIKREIKKDEQLKLIQEKNNEPKRSD